MGEGNPEGKSKKCEVCKRSQMKGLADDRNHLPLSALAMKGVQRWCSQKEDFSS